MTTFPEDAHAVVEGWSQVEATGPDAGKFLQAFCTNDVLRLADDESCEAMFTDVKARVVAYGWVCRWGEDRYGVWLGSSRADALASHLDRYLIREKVELESRSYPALSIGRFGKPLLPAFGEGVGFELGAPSSDRWGRRLSADEFERLRIGLGVPLDGVDVDQRNLPQEVDRNESAISFTKGCYLGQEPVARIDALGRVNWLLRGLAIDGPPPPRDTELVSDGKPVGRITSSVQLDGAAGQVASIALGYVRRERASQGQVLQVDSVAATVATLPMRR